MYVDIGWNSPIKHSEADIETNGKYVVAEDLLHELLWTVQYDMKLIESLNSVCFFR